MFYDTAFVGLKYFVCEWKICFVMLLCVMLRLFYRLLGCRCFVVATSVMFCGVC